MKVYLFQVAIAADVVDHAGVETILENAISNDVTGTVPSDALCLVGCKGVKEYATEHGWKVARKRMYGVSAVEAGDAVVKSKLVKLDSSPVEEEPAIAAS